MTHISTLYIGWKPIPSFIVLQLATRGVLIKDMKIDLQRLSDVFFLLCKFHLAKKKCSLQNQITEGRMQVWANQIHLKKLDLSSRSFSAVTQIQLSAAILSTHTIQYVYWYLKEVNTTEPNWLIILDHFQSALWSIPLTDSLICYQHAVFI